MGREGKCGGRRARVAKQRLRKSAPGAKRRDTVCAEERSAFRKRLCRERVEAVKQGCRRRRYACPVSSERENRNQVHDGAESEAGAS